PSADNSAKFPRRRNFAKGTAKSTPERRFKSWTVQNSRLIDILLCDRHATPDAESATRYFQSRRGLLAFVLVEIDTSLHPAHDLLIESVGDNVSGAQIFFHIEAQDFIENFVRRKDILIN